MNLKKTQKTNRFRKLSLIMAFVLAFAQMPQTGMLMAWAEPVQESAEEAPAEGGDVVQPSDNKDGAEQEPAGKEKEEEAASETVSGQEEEAASANTVSSDASDAETGEEAAGEQVPVEAGTWDAVQEAFNNGKNVLLSADISGEGKENPLTVSKNTTVTLDLNDHTINRGAENMSANNCVIRIEGGKLTLRDSSGSGQITGGKGTDGGGVHVGNESGDHSEFTMEGGWIYVNRAMNGGGVFIGNNCTFEMTGGIILGNTSEENGGGVYITATGQTLFNMTGGTIEDNTSEENGGGVYVTTYTNGKADVNMTGGIIKYNRATCGGGIYSETNGQNCSTMVNMTGGSIVNNEAADKGGGVYIRNSGFTMSNDSMIMDNLTYRGNGGGIYVHGNGGGSSLDMNGGWIENNTATKNGGGVFIATENGGNAEFKLNDGFITKNKADNDGGGIYSMTNGPGCNTLTEMIGGSIEENTAKSGGGVYLYNSGFTMKSGRINKNEATEEGGGVAVRGKTGGAAFTMNGGEITENSTEGHGGGAYVTAYTDGSTSGRADFKLIGGSIKNNKAERGGGLYFSTGRKEETTGSVVESVLTMSGGSILENEASEYGGGIFSRVTQHAWTILNLDGGAIEDNKAKNGGGIYTGWNWSRLKGTTIQNNSASQNGGGMFIDGGQCAVSGGSIEGNTAGANGGGMYVYYDAASRFELSGNFAIKDNKEGSVSGNVCLARNAYDPLIKITGKLENHDPVGVKLIDHNTGKPVRGVITQGLSGNGTLENFAGEGMELSLTADGEAKLAIPLEGIALPASATVEVGKTANIPVTFTPENATNKNVTWTISDANIATVANGVVTGVAEGSTVVTAKSEEGGFTASCNLTVTKAATEPTPVDPTKHTVKFFDGEEEIASQTVEDGQTLTEPGKKPQKEGYEFLGWAKGTSVWNFSTPVHSDFTLYAKYLSKAPEAVSKNTGSGMNPVARIEKTDKGRVIYLVKGQSYVAGGSGWTVKSGGGGITVAAKNGKITAKKKGHYIVSHEGEDITVAVAAPQFEKSEKTKSVMVGKTGSISLNINAESTSENEYYPVTWATAKPAVATVENGTITAYSKGSTNVYAYCGGKTYTAKITVTDTFKAPGAQKTENPYLHLNPMQSVNLKFDRSIGFNVKGASWNSISGLALVPTYNSKTKRPDGGFENSVIRITKAGKITAVGSTNEPIKIRGTNSGKEVFVTIDVEKIPSAENTYININKQVTVKFPYVNNNAAEWKTSNENVIPEVKKGKIKGKAVGKSTISCSYNGFDFSTLVYVEDPAFNTDDKLKLNNNKYTMTLKKGEVYNRVTMKNVVQTVYYKSSKTSVAFIDENGVIYARGIGKANITTKINGKTCKIAVTVEE